MVWLAGGAYTVGPEQRGIVLRFDQHVAVTDPGFHWHWPDPIEAVLRPKVTEVQRVEMGFRGIAPGPPARHADVASESLMLTGDRNIIGIELVAQYRIAAPAKYLFKVQHLPDMVKSASQAALREVLGLRHIDEALAVGRLEMREETKALLQSVLNTYETGLEVVAMQLQEAHSPKQVAHALHVVASARKDETRFINGTEGHQSAIIPEVHGKVEWSRARQKPIVRKTSAALRERRNGSYKCWENTKLPKKLLGSVGYWGRLKRFAGKWTRSSWMTSSAPSAPKSASN
jgi:modulator of FtsH protease HflK